MAASGDEQGPDHDPAWLRDLADSRHGTAGRLVLGVGAIGFWILVVAAIVWLHNSGLAGVAVIAAVVMLYLWFRNL